MKIAEYIFKQLKAHGVQHSFGIPGDFILPLYAAQEASGIKCIVMTHEPSAGYAADVYARLKGLGLATVTYGAGALNMVNAVALAYAEESPVLVLTGAPEVKFRNPNMLFHHRVKTFETQHNVYREVTASSAVINDESTAIHDIDRVIETTRALSRPGYIEVPRDMVNQKVSVPPRSPYTPPKRSKAELDEAMAEIIGRLRHAKKPVVYAGVELHRLRLVDKLRTLVERLNLPVTTSLMGKTVLPEHHPNFIGNYMGRVGPRAVRDYVESSDCVLVLGQFWSDLDTGLFTARPNVANLIQATTQEVVISHHRYTEINVADVLDALLKARALKHSRFQVHPIAKEPPRAESQGHKLTMLGIIDELNQFLSRDHIVVSDVGDCLFASVELKADMFVGSGYYASMGQGVPGAIGAQCADPSHRPVVLVGDGGFQMNGVELSVARRYGLNPIVIIIDNGTFATLKFIDQDRDYFDVPRWDYAGVAHALGGKGRRVITRSEFKAALKAADDSADFFVIDAVIDKNDSSPALKRLGHEIGLKFKKR